MSLFNSTMRVAALLSVVPLFSGATRGSTVHHATRVAQARQPESPAFGLVPVGPNQSIRLNVVCFMHQVGLVPPGPCRGTVMMHDVAGGIVNQGKYDLKPGQAARFEFSRPVTTTAGGKILIDPCWIPDPGGRIVPSVEVFDNTTGRVALYLNPAAARTSEFSNGRILDPGSLVGFNPQPDPPGFGMVTLVAGQALVTNVWCSAHGIGNTPPDPCRGSVMFHDALGNVVQSSTYALKPGEGAVITFAVRTTTDRSAGFIVPCVIPSPGGRAIPDVEVLDGNGATALLINPAVARMSQIDQ